MQASLYDQYSKFIHFCGSSLILRQSPFIFSLKSQQRGEGRWGRRVRHLSLLCTMGAQVVGWGAQGLHSQTGLLDLAVQKGHAKGLGYHVWGSPLVYLSTFQGWILTIHSWYHIPVHPRPMYLLYVCSPGNSEGRLPFQKTKIAVFFMQTKVCNLDLYSDSVSGFVPWQ